MGYTPLLCSPWSALSTVDEGHRCGCGLIGYWAFGGFTLDTRDARILQRGHLGKWPGRGVRCAFGVNLSCI